MKSQINLLKKVTSALSKKTAILLLAATLITASSFAKADVAQEKAAQNLKAEFNNAKDVQWKLTGDYLKASFTWNDQKLDVFFNSDGETIAKSREITTKSLPLAAQQTMAKRYAGYNVTEAIEYNSQDGEKCYFASLVNADKKMVVQISLEGSVSKFAQ